MATRPARRHGGRRWRTGPRPEPSPRRPAAARVRVTRLAGPSRAVAAAGSSAAAARRRTARASRTSRTTSVAGPGQQTGRTHAGADGQRRQQHGLAARPRSRAVAGPAHRAPPSHRTPYTEWHETRAREVHPRPSPIVIGGSVRCAQPGVHIAGPAPRADPRPAAARDRPRPATRRPRTAASRPGSSCTRSRPIRHPAAPPGPARRARPRGPAGRYSKDRAATGRLSPLSTSASNPSTSTLQNAGARTP